jgi:hypothetical protein
MINLPYVVPAETPLNLNLTTEVSAESMHIGSIFNSDQKLYLKAQITDLLQQLTEVEFTSVVDATAHVKVIEIRSQIRCLKWLLQQSDLSEVALSVEQ